MRNVQVGATRPGQRARIATCPVRHRFGACALTGRVVEQELRRGASVVIDFIVNQEARAAWQDPAERYGASFSVVECLCSDRAIHRARVEHRSPEIPGWYELSWEQVERSRDNYTELCEPKLVRDAVNDFGANLARTLAYLGVRR